MCGITALYNKSGLSSDYLSKCNVIVAHRGPDDEGYLLWKPGDPLQVLSGNDTAESTQHFFKYPVLPSDSRDWLVGLGHRRLSIIDLSPHGHQPMVLTSRGLTITFNGEIYNYIEIREELKALGHHFETASDTEVILHAWVEWSKESLHRFNGMFAFVLLDSQQQKVYAVRDRFGVKPLYYTETNGYMAFASEVKQLRELPGYRFSLNEQIAYDYLRYSLIDHDRETFENGIRQLMPGHFIELDLASGKWRDSSWYTLQAASWKGTEEQACEQFYALLKGSVRLRMRSDVPIGSALSGGLDSSTIVCLMREVLEGEGRSDHLIKTITSCSEDKRYDEWVFAEEVIKKIKAEPYQTFPSFEKLRDDLDRIIWHMDYPFGSTSQFSQWCVFEEARKQGLTVMIDGQGADEQLAGYGGNDVALYAGLLRSGNIIKWFKEARSYKKRNGKLPYGFLLGSLKVLLPGLIHLFPPQYRSVDQVHPVWLKPGKYKSRTYSQRSLQVHLTNQVQVLPLPSLLRYEDRNSMAFSVESRVPFMDYRLLEFTKSLSEDLIYREGERKYILRRAFRGKVPDKILDRKDKMGFVSAEERWLMEEGKEWFKENLQHAGSTLSTFVDAERINNYIQDMQAGHIPFSFDPWRLICLGRWIVIQ